MDGDRAIVRSGRSRFTLATLPAADFPKVPSGESDVSVELGQDSLRALIEDVSFAMAQQDVRYFLNGMLLEVTSDHIRAVATDGHRLAMSTADGGADVPSRVHAIVPRKGVLEINRLLDDQDATIQLHLGGNHLQVQSGPFTLTTKLVDGQFPDYQKVVPADASRAMRGDRETLRLAFQRASILSNEKYRGVRLTLDGEQLVIQANNPEQEEAEEIVEEVVEVVEEVEVIEEEEQPEGCGEGTHLEDGVCVLDETVESTSGSSPTTGFSAWVYSISFTILIAFAIMIVLYAVSRASKNKA